MEAQKPCTFIPWECPITTFKIIPMNKTIIPHTDLEVAPINFGGNVFGWTLNEVESFAMLDSFVDAGLNFVDTADTYSWWVNGKGGQSESILGEWMKSRGNRNQMVIATKVGSETQEHGFDISREHILKSADASLKRLQTDHIDLYYTHFDDKTTPVEETLDAYAQLIKAGKVRYIAASNIAPARLEESFAVAEAENLPKYVALQPHYNLMERKGYETDYAPIAQKHGLAVFPYWSLASGFLTGKYRSEKDLGKSVRGGSAKKYLTPQGMAVLEALDQTAKKHGTEPAAVSLAWLLTRPNVGAPIVSATNDAQLQTLAKAPKLHLDLEDIELLEHASAGSGS